MKTKQHIKLARQTALILFLLGTTIFGLYFSTSSFEVLLAGYGFIAVAGLINAGVLISILDKAAKGKGKKNTAKLFAACRLMLANIPIMLFYCWAAAVLLNTMRITFTNTTQTALTDINVVGCGGGHIDRLESGESQTLWVGITGDCSIGIEYISRGQKKKESVAGYVTGTMGQKIKHKIGGENPEQF